MARNYFVSVFIGGSGTGKTVTAIQIAKDWKKSRKKISGKVIVFDPHDNFNKVSDLKIKATDEDWAKILMQRNKDGSYMFSESLLILDDYRSILRGNNMDADFYDLLALRRKIGIDIMYMTHNPKLILQGLVPWNTHFFIFNTHAHSDDFESKIPEYFPCQQASNLVNAYANTFTESEYKSLYPNFPYVFVKSGSTTLHPVNMSDWREKKLQLS